MKEWRSKRFGIHLLGDVHCKAGASVEVVLGNCLNYDLYDFGITMIG